MRTTIEFDDDTAKAVEELRRESGLGVSDATNQLIRQGLLARPPERSFRPRRRPLGLHIDVSNVAEALDVLEGTDAR
ncbi:MAG: ribbon-helix-helix protein, CopG family [Ilumatobacteraceae bacterium]